MTLKEITSSVNDIAMKSDKSRGGLVGYIASNHPMVWHLVREPSIGSIVYSIDKLVGLEILKRRFTSRDGMQYEYLLYGRMGGSISN